jgi:hypothetical protein
MTPQTLPYANVGALLSFGNAGPSCVSKLQDLISLVHTGGAWYGVNHWQLA